MPDGLCYRARLATLCRCPGGPHMTITRAQVRQELLEQMGLGREGVKYGSKIVPLLFLVLAVFAYVVPKTNTAHDDIARIFMRYCEAARSAPPQPGVAPALEPSRAAGPSDAKKPTRPPRPTTLLGQCGDGQTPLDKIEAEFKSKKTLTAKADQFDGADPKIIGRWTAISELMQAFGKAYLADLFEAIGTLPNHAATVGWIVVTAAAFSLLPGLAGLIYRRSFGRWFAISFILMIAVPAWSKVGSNIKKISSVDADGADGVPSTETLFILLVSLMVALLLSHRLRRYTSSNLIDLPFGLYNKLLGALLVAIAIAINYYDFDDRVWSYLFVESYAMQTIFMWEFILIGLPLVYTLFRQSTQWTGRRPKNIVVCFDGTNNTPDQYELGQLAQTNVFKLFRLLKSDAPTAAFPRGAFDASMCKRYKDKQIAFYYIGVGNQFENSPIGQVLGQAMGMGATGLVDRAYLDVMRVYSPGDRVYIFGFSRGAAIARLLARAIDKRGAPRSMWTLRLFGRHWVVWKSKPVAKTDGGVPITVLGCWDTVGAFGLAKKVAGIDFQKIDLFKDLSIPNNVEQAYHMVALDEERDSFAPTLMEPDPIRPGRVVEVWFSGDHANVGGGWATTKLADITLDFLLRQVTSGYAGDKTMTPGDEAWGLYANAINGGAFSPNDPATSQSIVLDPDPLGQLRQWTSVLYDYAPRKLPLHAVISDSVFERMTHSGPIYAPQSLFNLNEDMDKKRQTVSDAVKRLSETKSLDEAERDEIMKFRDKLRLTRWTHHVEALRTLKADPAQDMALYNATENTGAP